MSKMRMPEMSVVRFNESDVIVASSAVRLYDWFNPNKTSGGDHDGAIEVSGERIYLNNPSATGNDLYSTFGTNNPSEINFSLGSVDTTKSLYTLIQNDNTSTNSGNEGYDGYYTYDSAANWWIHQ